MHAINVKTMSATTVSLIPTDPKSKIQNLTNFPKFTAYTDSAYCGSQDDDSCIASAVEVFQEDFQNSSFPKQDNGINEVLKTLAYAIFILAGFIGYAAYR